MGHAHHQHNNERKQEVVWVASIKEVVQALLLERLRAIVEQVSRRHGWQRIGRGYFANREGDRVVE